MNKQNILKTDILDIIFEKRNKLYGAYNLRKFYPNRLKMALALMFITAAMFSAFTFLPKNEHKIATKIYDIKDPGLTIIKHIPIEPAKKPAVVKPQVLTVKKANPVNQKLYVSNFKIVPDNIKTDSFTTLLPKDIIGNKTIVDATPGLLPVVTTAAFPVAGGGEKAIPAIDKALPMNEDAVDLMPSYPGGMEALSKFLQKNLQSPAEMESGETVSVRVKFVVDYSGKLKSFVTVLDGGQPYNNEVVRVLKKMPHWIPGKAKGENVSVYYVIPVKFTGAD